VALADKQQRFIAEYLVDLNATQATIPAGGSEMTARQSPRRTCQNLTWPKRSERHAAGEGVQQPANAAAQSRAPTMTRRSLSRRSAGSRECRKQERRRLGAPPFDIRLPENTEQIQLCRSIRCETESSRA